MEMLALFVSSFLQLQDFAIRKNYIAIIVVDAIAL